MAVFDPKTKSKENESFHAKSVLFLSKQPQISGERVGALVCANEDSGFVTIPEVVELISHFGDQIRWFFNVCHVFPFRCINWI